MIRRLLSSWRGLGAGVLLLAPLGSRAASGPIEFRFAAPPNAAVANPYARALWGEVVLPSGRHRVLPAFASGEGWFGIRARPEEQGTYTLGEVTEEAAAGRRVRLAVRMVSGRQVDYRGSPALPAIQVDPADRRRFRRSDGRGFVPVGSNLAWATDHTLGYHLRALQDFAAAGLNWMRVWMAHWNGLDLDWLSAEFGRSPPPGTLDEGVARRWDALVEAAEANGVYLQVVLQHHGQYTTYNDSDWAINPWNAANPGGFLRAPEDFFTDPRARALTRQKYRTIAARYGWCPAIMAWELFNEVHWTNAMREGHEDAVARWHSEMAAYLRSVDPYGHLITTSTENLLSPIYRDLDYYQPHLYADNLLAAARVFDPPPSSLDRPVFYGEMGEAGGPAAPPAAIAGAVWASLMGEGGIPAQPWDGWQFFERRRLGELGAVARFIAGSGLADQAGLRPFSAAVACGARVPLRIEPSRGWAPGPGPDLVFPVDGTQPLALAGIPGILDGRPGGASAPQATWHVDFPRAARVAVRIGAVSATGGNLRLFWDGKLAAAHRWPGGTGAPDPAELAVDADPGWHALRLENDGGWVRLSGVNLGLETSALAAIGRRSDRFIAAWIWNRAGLRAPEEPAPVSGVLQLGPVPAGDWNVTWWDTRQGHPTMRSTINHPGGPLELPTPPVGRDAAVVLVRSAGDGAGPAPGGPEAGPRIGVRGNRFVTPDGEPVLFRGLCLADPDKLAREGRWNRALFAAVKGMGANLVRLPVHPSAWRSRTPDGYVKLLDQAVDWCGSLGLYVIIDWHSIGNLQSGMFQDPMYQTSLPETLAFWRTIAGHFRGRPTVAFYELFNEPTHFNGMLGPMSWTEWRDLNEEMIGVIRYWDRETIPLVAGFDWAYDLDPVRYEPVRAEGIGYVAHPYPDKRPRPWEPKWEEDFAFAADRYPMIATEIGFSLPAGGKVGDDDYGNRITRFLESRGIGWMAWVFDPDWRPQLLRSFEGFALTGSGEFFRRALQRPPALPGSPPAPVPPAPPPSSP